MVFFELREYKVLPGKMDEWINFMEGIVMPFIEDKGMVVTASFIGPDNDNTYIWMRRFNSEAERKRQYASVYESGVWKQEISPKVGELINREQTVVRAITATHKSPIQ